jgi:hypothetical protein
MAAAAAAQAYHGHGYPQHMTGQGGLSMGGRMYGGTPDHQQQGMCTMDLVFPLMSIRC